MTAYHVQFPDGSRYGPADEEMLRDWARQGRLRPEAMLHPADESGPPTRAGSHPALAPFFNAPPSKPGPLPEPPAEPIASVIPYTNPAALIGYYVAVFSLVPGLGLILGPAAVFCGISGWKRYRAEPRCKGAAHAWVAIVLGSLVALASWGAVVVVVLMFPR